MVCFLHLLTSTFRAVSCNYWGFCTDSPSITIDGCIRALTYKWIIRKFKSGKCENERFNEREITNIVIAVSCQNKIFNYKKRKRMQLSIEIGSNKLSHFLTNRQQVAREWRIYFAKLFIEPARAQRYSETLNIIQGQQ